LVELTLKNFEVAMKKRSVTRRKRCFWCEAWWRSVLKKQYRKIITIK